VFLIFASLLFWLDFFRVYQTEVSVLFVTKEERVAAPGVASSLGAIMKTLTFAERVEKDAGRGSFLPDVESKDEKKEYWNENLDVTLEKGNGVLLFSQKGATSEESQEKAKETLDTLLLATNLYFGGVDEVEVRIIDQPVTTLALKNVFGYILASLGTAIVVTSFFFGLLTLLSSRNTTTKTSSLVQDHIGESVAWINPDKFVAVRPTTLSYQEPVVTEEVIDEKVEIAPLRQSQKVASAPGNLPIMAGALPQFGILETPEILEDAVIMPEIEVVEEVLPEEAPITIEKNLEEEPTVEEYKRRLNELLKGNSPR